MPPITAHMPPIFTQEGLPYRWLTIFNISRALNMSSTWRFRKEKWGIGISWNVVRSFLWEFFFSSDKYSGLIDWLFRKLLNFVRLKFWIFLFVNVVVSKLNWIVCMEFCRGIKYLCFVIVIYVCWLSAIDCHVKNAKLFKKLILMTMKILWNKL